MAYDQHYDRLLRAIQNGEEKEAISLFASKLFDVNEQIEYIFEDRKRYIVTQNHIWIGQQTNTTSKVRTL